MAGCDRCHTCGARLQVVLDGEELCPRCLEFRRYRGHGWAPGFADRGDPGCAASLQARASRAASALIRISRDLAAAVDDCEAVAFGECLGLIVDRQVRRAQGVLDDAGLELDEFFRLIEDRIGAKAAASFFGELRQGLYDLSQGRRL